MIVYHGTTRRRARSICQVGFLPKKPSRRVWFAEGHRYAYQRARTQAQRAHDRPIVLTCELSLHELRQRLGKQRVFHKHGVIAIDGSVSPCVLRSSAEPGLPSSPKELADWINRLLGLRPHKGVPQTHPGLQRLSRWMVNRLKSRPDGKIKPSEVVHLARQWLPEYFAGVQVDVVRLRSRLTVERVRKAVEPVVPPPDPREEQAVACLESDSALRRARGLRLLARLQDPDLFDWCAMFLQDESADVRVAALRSMRQCDPDDPSLIEPHAHSGEKRIRAAAIAALAKHGGKDADRWYERGLKDPEPCVRMETAAVLKYLDPKAHRRIFELARHDPNPEIAKRATKLTAHKGYPKLMGVQDRGRQ